MSSIKYDMGLRLHLGNDTRRPAMMKVSNGGNGYVYSSDAHTLMKVPAFLCKKEYEQVQGYPNAEKIFKQFEAGEPVDYELDSLIELLGSFELWWVFKKDECKECSGIGTGECPCCGQDADCKHCDGQGEIDSKEPFVWMNPILDNNRVKIGEYLFNPRYVYRAIHTALLLDVKKLTIIPPKDKTMQGIKFILKDGVELFVMPTIN